MAREPSLEVLSALYDAISIRDIEAAAEAGFSEVADLLKKAAVVAVEADRKNRRGK